MSATIIEVPKTCKALPEPVAVLPHRVGDVITWGNVQPGTLVRLQDNREVLRWRECDAYGDDVTIMYPGRPCLGKIWQHGHRDRDDITADTPCVVLGAGLSERMCAAVAEVDDQPQRWAIANGYYGRVSNMPTGSVWTYPGGWGVTFAGGQVAWVNYDGDDLIRMSRTEVLELEARLSKCVPADTDNDLFMYGLAHCEMQNISDEALETVITHSDPHAELMSLASTRCHSDDASWARKWISEKVADWATFHVRPDVRAGMKAKALLCVLDILRTSPPPRHLLHATAWPTLRALGIHVCRPTTEGDLYGWWGQENAPTRAASAVDLLLAYLTDAPGYAASAHAALGDLSLGRTDIWLRAATPSFLQTTISLPSTAGDDEDYQLAALAEQVSVQLYQNNTWCERVTMPYLRIIDGPRGIAVLTELRSADVAAKTAPVVDCGLQPVVLHHSHPCTVLVLWPYDSSPRGRLLFTAAAVAILRKCPGDSSIYKHKLRIQLA